MVIGTLLFKYILIIGSCQCWKYSWIRCNRLLLGLASTDHLVRRVSKCGCFWLSSTILLVCVCLAYFQVKRMRTLEEPVQSQFLYMEGNLGESSYNRLAYKVWVFRELVLPVQHSPVSAFFSCLVVPLAFGLLPWIVTP